MGDGFEKLASIPFRFGAKDKSLTGIVGPAAVKRFRTKFPEPSDRELFVTAREMVRFLYLAAHSPESLFFPGNTLMDELWHSLVIETAEYREFCNSLRPGTFLEHSGMKFHDYLTLGDEKRIHEEQSSWLASYVANFGHFDEDSLSCLNLLQELSRRTGADLARLNAFADLLIEATKSEQAPFNFASFVSTVLRPNAAVLDRDPGLMKDALQALVSGLRTPSGEFRVDNPQLESLFSASTAFAFTLMQHLAAVDRLEGLPDWQNSNAELWGELSSGRKLCGLATTNLARPGGAGVTAEESANAFTLNGRAPWVCGLGIFEYLLVGFETENSFVFATIEAPRHQSQNLSARLLPLACLNGAATYEVTFHGYTVAKRDLVSRREKDTSPRPRLSQFVIPELGIGAGALAACEEIVSHSSHPRHALAREALVKFKQRLEKIREARSSGESVDLLTVMRDEFNRDSVRLLTLATGAASLLEGSLPARLQNELLLLDTVVQSPETLQRKIKLAGTEKNT